MGTAIIKKQSLTQILIADAVLVGAMAAVPALSHITAWPLYQLNPMLLALLAGMLLVRDRRNALLLAVLLPAVSCLATGMPTPLKALCMGAELCTVAVLFGALQRFARTPLRTFVVMAGAIVAGKAVFYLLKALILAPAVLVGTPLLTQALVAVAAAAVFALLEKR